MTGGGQGLMPQVAGPPVKDIGRHDDRHTGGGLCLAEPTIRLRAEREVRLEKPDLGLAYPQGTSWPALWKSHPDSTHASRHTGLALIIIMLSLFQGYFSQAHIPNWASGDKSWSWERQQEQGAGLLLEEQMSVIRAGAMEAYLNDSTLSCSHQLGESSGESWIQFHSRCN